MSAPEGLRGCGCAKWAMPVTSDELQVGEWTHRYSKPCFRVTPDGGREYEDFKSYRTMEQRISDLERVVADLVRGKSGGGDGQGNEVGTIGT